MKYKAYTFEESQFYGTKVRRTARENLLQVCLRKIARLIELEEYSVWV